MRTAVIGGVSFVVELTDRAVARLAAEGYDLAAGGRGDPNRLARRTADVLFARRDRYAEVLYLVLLDQIPADWTPERFAAALVRAGVPAVDALRDAAGDWLQRQARPTGRAD